MRNLPMKIGMIKNPDGSWDVNLTDEELDRALQAVSVPYPNIAPADDEGWMQIIQAEKRCRP